MAEVGIVAFGATIPLTEMELEGEIGAIAFHRACAVRCLDGHDLPHPVKVSVDGNLITSAEHCYYGDERGKK